MGTPEGKVKAFIDRRMNEWFPEAFKYSPPGVGTFGKNGMPDRMWLMKATDVSSLVVAIEAKAEGNTMTELQKKTMLRLMDQGVACFLVTGKDEEKMEEIRAEIVRRLRVADAESRPSTVHPSEDHR